MKIAKQLSHLIQQVLAFLQQILSGWILHASPRWVFSAFAVFTLIWASFIPSLRFNYNIESFFSSDDEEVGFYYEHREGFENENDFVLIGLKAPHGIFQQDFLQKTDSLSKALKKIPHVKKVFSPTNLYETVKGHLGGIRVPLIHIDQPEQYALDQKKIYTSRLYKGAFFAHDTSSVSLLVRKEGDLAKQSNDSLLFTLHQAIQASGFEDYHIAGRIQTQQYYISNMRKQMVLFAGLASILFLVALYIILREVRYVVLALSMVLTALVWIFGIIAALGIQIDLMLTLIPALIFIISTSSTIHLINRFRQEYQEAKLKKHAIHQAAIETGLPNFLNAFTTALGFASLFVLPVAPIQQFGLLVALGTLTAFAVNLLLLPITLRTLTFAPIAKNLQNAQKPNHFLLQIIAKQPHWITGSFVLLLGGSLLGLSQIEINNYFLDDLSPSSSLKQDLDFFEKNFSGIRPFEMNIQARGNQNLLSLEALIEMDTVEQYLQNNYGVGFMFSPLAFIKGMNKALYGGRQEHYRLPEEQKNLDRILKLAKQQRVWSRYVPVLQPEQSIGRITGRTKDEGSKVFREKNKALQTFLQSHTHLLDYQLTGTAHLMDNANLHIASNMTVGIFLAITISTLIIWIFTSSWRLALISILTNTFPLIVVAGIMGAFGIPLKVATSLIFTISYGIAVDDTIHFLNSFQQNFKDYSDVNQAVKNTVEQMWRPMLYTSIVLFSGFLIFIASAFPSIALLGFLVGASLLIALLADLLLLPLLLKKMVNTKPVMDTTASKSIASTLQAY